MRERISVPGEGGERDVPEATRGVMNRTPEAPLRRKISGEWGDRLGVVTRVVGELDGDGFGSAVGDGPVQFLDGPFRLNTLVKADEAYSLGKP